MEIIFFFTEKYKNLSGGYNLSSSFFVDENTNGFTVNDRKVDRGDFYHPEGKIKLSVIVGENGSGKSNLLKGILYNLCDSFNKKNESRDLIVFESEGDIYYISNKYQSITYKNKSVKRESINFFTMYFNYMMDHFCGKDESWSDQIFHRADSYKTPILIEPFKKNGLIDVTTVEYLNKQRIILHKEYGENSILNDVFNPMAAKVSINLEKIKKILLLKKPGIYLTKIFETYADDLEGVFSAIFYYEKYAEINSGPTLTSSHRFSKFISKPRNEHSDFDSFVNNRLLYSLSDKKFPNIQKILNRINLKANVAIDNEILRLDLRIINLMYIANKNDRLNLIGDVKSELLIFKNHNFDVKVILNDKTHRTEKLRNAVEFQDHLNYSIMYDREFSKILHSTKSFDIDSLFLKSIPSWFDVELHDNRGVDYSSLSSGEKSFYNLLTTIKYHLRNLSGYDEGKKNIILLLDEVDLGLHPKWQRDFIYNIISFLDKYFVDKFNFHIIITSHSPFLLSDVLLQSTLLIKDGNKCNLSDHNHTFGQNIHSLLSDSFFISDGLLTGYFAHKKLESSFNVMTKFLSMKSKNFKRLVAFKNYEKNRESYIKIKDVIGDDYLSLAFNNILEESECKYKKLCDSHNNDFDLELIKLKIENNPELYEKILRGDI
ncbi:AAA family ATPase [Vibrio rotiferianus]|uniref:AAA family ATPase n=1 Tax=Vibrio rotiferianus TaxID=190895 RepID=UPI0024928154|nr:AAA family ATPase [Vibrio rotiferianus]